LVHFFQVLVFDASLRDHLNSQNLLVKNKHQFDLLIFTNNLDFPKTFLSFMKTKKQGFLNL
jgi:hypothetical protein